MERQYLWNAIPKLYHPKRDRETSLAFITNPAMLLYAPGSVKQCPQPLFKTCATDPSNEIKG